jgi:hypothetical protein
MAMPLNGKTEFRHVKFVSLAKNYALSIRKVLAILTAMKQK